MATNGQLSFADLDVMDEVGPQTGASMTEAPGPENRGVSPSADRAALAALEAALDDARASADDRPPLVVLASCVGQSGAASAAPSPGASPVRASLRQARDDWLRRLETSQKSASALVAYRVAIDDLLDWSETSGRSVFDEASIVTYLSCYRERAQPAPATYYRRFLL